MARRMSRRRCKTKCAGLSGPAHRSSMYVVRDHSSNGACVTRSTEEGALYPGTKRSPKIAHEIVVGRIRVRLCNAAKATGHPRFHFNSRKFSDNRLHLEIC